LLHPDFGFRFSGCFFVRNRSNTAGKNGGKYGNNPERLQQSRQKQWIKKENPEQKSPGMMKITFM